MKIAAKRLQKPDFDGDKLNCKMQNKRPCPVGHDPLDITIYWQFSILKILAFWKIVCGIGKINKNPKYKKYPFFVIEKIPQKFRLSK